MKHLVVAEHSHGKIGPATLSAVTAAVAVGGEIHLLLAGADFPVTIAGVTKVRVCADACYKELSAENVAALIVSIAKEYTHIWVGASSFGKETMPRVAAALDMGQISDIMKVVSADTFVRPIYAGNAFCTVQSSDAIKIITVRASAFSRAGEGAAVAAEPVASAGETKLSRFVSREEQKSDRPDLGSARIVVSGGRGVGSKENFAIIEKLADKLGAAIGASRAAVDAGYIPNDRQVGQTGKIIAPDLYIAIGISGAIQHLAGMMGSKTIVAINKDENAPIFGVADYGLVGDLFAILPELDASL